MGRKALDGLLALVGAQVRVARRLLLLGMLVLLYVFGFALTWLFLAVFNRRQLRAPAESSESSWLPASGYASNEDSWIHPS